MATEGFMEPDFLLESFREVRGHIPSNKQSMIYASLMKDEYIEAEDMIYDEYVRLIDDMVKIYQRARPGMKPKYAINIKIHSIDLTDEMRGFMYDNMEGAIKYFNTVYVEPWAKNRTPRVYSAGRSGGWLILDRKVIHPEHNNGDLWDLRKAYEDVYAFRKEWDSLFSDMKDELEYIMENPEEREF